MIGHRREEEVMDFRWVVGITLWTMFIGPVIGPPQPAPTKPTAVAATPHPADRSAARP
jgi:hypothetical protein